MGTMTQQKIRTINKKLLKNYKRLANDIMKTKPEWILDLKAHFKRPDAWPLSYMFYYEISGLYSVPVYNIILKKLKLRAVFTRDAELRIYKAKV